MDSVDTMNLRLAMEEPWYKEYWTFVMVPALATAACCFIPLFRGEQGMNSMAALPLTAAFSYGHTLSPRKAYYDKSWKKTMEYHDFVLANAKRALLFSAPTGLIAWATTIFLQGRAKEMAMFFETTTWGLTVGIFMYCLMTYIPETLKLRKTDAKASKANIKNLWKWMIPSTTAFSLLAFSKIYFLLELVKGRP